MSRAAVALRALVLGIGAVLFLFPFYYMIIGSLQLAPDQTVAGAFPHPGNLTGANYAAINSRIGLLQGLVNSGIFTGGVIICTIVFAVLVGYALAVLEWRGRGVTFALALLVQVVPFQLLIIPLYVLIARDYGLADNYLGMILPFAINSTAVIIFRQYFLQVPKELFEAARIDGAGELSLLLRVALPLVRPALVTVVLLTFIGPWNEFLWPFLITKRADMQPLAVSLANYITNVAATAANPFGAAMAGAVVLAAPLVVLFVVFQRYFISTDLGSGVKGVTSRSVPAEEFPYRLTRLGVVMRPEPGNPLEVEGVLNPGSGRDPEGRLHLLPRLVAAGNVSRVGLAAVVLTDGVPTGVERLGVVLEPERSWESGAGHGGVEDPRVTWVEALGVHVATYVAYGPLGPRTAVATSTDLRHWTRHGPVLYGYDDTMDIDLNLYPNKDTAFFPEPVIAPDGTPSLAVLHRPMWDLDEVVPGQGDRPPPGLPDDRGSIWIAFVPLAEVRHDLSALVHWRQHRLVAVPEHPFEALKIGGGPPPRRVPEGWLLLHHGVTGVLARAFAQQKNVNYAAGGLILDAERPWEVVLRTSTPLLAAETPDERAGIVPNVVFPTAIEEVDGVAYVFYGMADSAIGVARLDPANHPPRELR